MTIRPDVEAHQPQQAAKPQAVYPRAAREAIAAFRGAGKGGTVEQLLADRRADGAGA